MSRGTTPLEGVRVLDFTRVLSGPHCTRMLADLGAEVIKVEPPSGDLTRFAAPRVNSLSTYFIQQNTGKANISVDFDRPEAIELLHRLAAACDVVVENFRPGVMERNRLGYKDLAVFNPRLIYASITGYGSTGPWADRRAYAAVVNAETGLTLSQGDARDGRYANDPHSHGDVYTSLETCTAILAALYQRDRTGRGQWIEVSMAETLLYVNEHLHDQLWRGPVEEGAVRSFQPGDYAVVEVANGDKVVIAGHPAERGTFEYFVAAMQRPHLLDDPRFADPRARLQHLEDLHREIADFAATMPDGAAIEARFAAHQLAVGVLRSSAEVCETDWARERQVIVEVSDRGGSTVRIPDAPWHFSDAPGVGVHGEPRYRGEDNRSVLGELLGLDEAQLDALEANGVISARSPRR